MWDPIPRVYRIALTVMGEISKMALKIIVVCRLKFARI
jgi:hypothetical protein